MHRQKPPGTPGPPDILQAASITSPAAAKPGAATNNTSPRAAPLTPLTRFIVEPEREAPTPGRIMQQYRTFGKFNPVSPGLAAVLAAPDLVAQRRFRGHDHGLTGRT
jgi:hypothetical protein